MKKLAILLLSCSALLSACGGGSNSKTSASVAAVAQKEISGIEAGTLKVLSFHTNQRCVTCKRMEQLTREVVAELNNDRIKLEVVNISDHSNEAIADQYEVTWSALVLDNGMAVENLTQMAFANAKNQPEEFKRLLKAAIAKQLQ